MKKQDDVKVCKNCKFGVPEIRGFIVCRHHSPQALEGDYGKFPVMYKTEGCGDYQPKIIDKEN